MSTLQIHVGGSFADDTRRILAAAARAKAGVGAEPESHVSFEDWNTFFRVLTPGRIVLLHHIHAHAVRSVRALAAAVGRDYRRVHADVEALVTAGLVERHGTALTTDWDGSEADFVIPLSA